MLTAGNINEAYTVIGIVHATVTRVPESAGFGQPKSIQVINAYADALEALKGAAARSGADGLIHVAYEHRVAVGAAPGCTGNKTQQVFELYGWETAICLTPVTPPALA